MLFKLHQCVMERNDSDNKTVTIFCRVVEYQFLSVIWNQKIGERSTAAIVTKNTELERE